MTLHAPTRACSRIAFGRVLHWSNLTGVRGIPVDVLADLDDETFSTPVVCKMARVSFRQVDYWTRIGLIAPEKPAHGSGSQRRFTGAQARDVAMIGRLRELGVGLDAIEEVLSLLRTTTEGALVVIAPGFVRVVEPLDVAAAITEAAGAAIVLAPETLRVLVIEDEEPRPPRHRRAAQPSGARPGGARW